MAVFMLWENEMEIDQLTQTHENIDDTYYEVFRLIQDELQEAVDEHPLMVPTERVVDILNATDLFYKRNYGFKKKNTDRQHTERI